MDQRELKRQNEEYLARLKTLEKEHGAMGLSHFRHIARNIAQLLFDCDKIGDFDWERDQALYTGAQADLDAYLALVNDFPDFRDGEMKTEKGFFTKYSGDYVTFAVNALRA